MFIFGLEMILDGSPPGDVSNLGPFSPVSTSATRLDPTKTTEQPSLFKCCAVELGSGEGFAN